MADTLEPRRHSLRLRGFDYSQSENYFITICAHDRKLMFGAIAGGKMILNSAGEAVRAAWFGLPRRFPSVVLREFIVMPNHLHAILGLTQPIRAIARGAASSAPTAGRPGVPYPALGKIIRAFKSLSAIQVNRALGQAGRSVWQRNYYERVIRPGKEYGQIRKYMLENPLRWDEDPENI